jgi:VIT1/CCC1 family predicted Fe2+/Mn2+ transporter
VASLLCTLAALFALGVVKGRLARMAILTSGLQVAVIGSLSAGLGFAIGRIVNGIAG